MIAKKLSALWLLPPVIFLLLITGSCRYPHPDISGWDIPQRTKDSLTYLAEHHYTLNTNFKVLADSLPLEQLPIKEKFRQVYKNDMIVVAEFMTISQDSIDSVWVKVARDQNTQGWIRETELLKQTVPTDFVSQFIHLFSNKHTVYFLTVFTIFVIFFLFRALYKKKIKLVYFNDINSIFPLLLCLLIATSATLYGSLQLFAPDTWEHYYFNPTLNPFHLPPSLGFFIASVWIILILSLATLEDLFKQVSLSVALFYLTGLASVSIACYLFFTFTVSYYIGYLFLLLLFYVVLKRIGKGTSYKYRCGNCNAKMRQKGECPNCGAINT